MAGKPAVQGQRGDPAGIFDGAFRIVVVLAVALIALTSVRLVIDGVAGRGGSEAPGASPSATATVDVRAYLEPDPRPAPPLALTGAGGAPFSLDGMRDGPMLIFFGYTHCPDVCPATIGTVSQAVVTYGRRTQAVLVSVDPERDTPEWLAEYLRFMPPGFSAATGTHDQLRTVANAWGVRYARVDGNDPSSYAMAHTADVFVVDRAGMLRARFPFGTDAPTMVAVLRAIEAATAPPTPTPAGPTPAPAATPIADLVPDLVSSSVWAGGRSPMIFTLADRDGRIDDPALDVRVQLLSATGAPVGGLVGAVPVRPSGITIVSYVAVVDIPSPGGWRFAVTAASPTGAVRQGPLEVSVLDPGGSVPLGARAPGIRTATAADHGGVLAFVSTDPLPDPRLSRTSTADALATGRPFVLVVDSYSFKVTEACGQAVLMAKRLLDRWRDMTFIHHEPYRYSVVTAELVLEGTLENPRLTDVAEAWGVGSPPWGAASMPWVFIVDGDGIVRAKYQGILGSADVDVILSLLAQE
jgi:protein SCO1